jgi:hypothetical protein
MNLIDSVKRYTTVVADTGDIEAIAEYKPRCHDQPFAPLPSGSETAVRTLG